MIDKEKDKQIVRNRRKREKEGERQRVEGHFGY